ncbi:DUF968 domain-containing protein [Vreelandella populi]|uniref:DUF968 domain-containing protein n=1 Tax=Vreelandella populi TaxID=2498858 RepID=UPI000F8D70A2|nr:DUF968 domain-containing protein [Halomonas populi]RUR52721.1 DUF968 domain-containing protein [Halomonas populi]
MKDFRYRSEKYLAFVRSLPCSVCGTDQGVVAHHLIGMWGMSGMGLKAPDSMTLPVCDGPGNTCHRLVHNNKALRDQQPQWLRTTLRAGIAQFTGDDDEQLTHALAFVEAKEQ